MGAINDMQQSILDAMQAVSTKAANSTNAAITIKCTISDIVDAGLGLYEVKYGDNNFNAYTESNSSYKSGDIVYVLVPDGDFSQQKIIIGTTAPRASMFAPQTETELYIPISENLFGETNSIDLRSWMDETYNIDIDTNNFGLIFSNYLKTYRNFLFTANIKTEIDKDHQVKGNYGLILKLPFIESSTDGGGTSKPIWKSFIMDVSTIQGNPYDFNVYQQVNLYCEIPDNLTYDNTRVPTMEGFTSDFGYTATRTDIDYDIHIKNIAIKIVDVLSESDRDGYYLSIVSSDGNYFLSGKYTQDKILFPILKINGVNTKTDKWECYWFVEDTSIDISDESYLSIGGLGWKCLNKKVNVTYDSTGKKTFQYVTNQYTLKITKEDVISTLRYKCVLVQDEIVVGGKIKLTNLNNNIIIDLVSATGSNSFVADVGYVDLVARIYYPGVTDVTNSNISLSTSWQRFDKNDDYIDNEFYEIKRYNDPVVITDATGSNKTYWETEIIYPCSELDKMNSINCSFYSTTTKNGVIAKNNLGTKSIIVSTTSGFTYGVAIQGGDVLYKYDADGDSPLVANYDGPITSKVTTIAPLSYKVYKADGSELTDTEYLYCYYTWSFPKNSMMTLLGYNLKTIDQDDDYYYIKGYGESNLNYSILNTFNKKKSNNTIILKVNFDNTIIEDTISPKFLKDGMSGTNGSKYSAVISYDSYAYGERDSQSRIRKLQVVYINGYWKIFDITQNKLIDFNNPQLNIDVYKDGNKITSGYSISWSLFDSASTNPCMIIDSDGTLRIKTGATWYDSSAIYCNTIEAQITINENSNTNSKEVIYAYYPIELTRLKNAGMAESVIPNLSGGFEEVVFASDGTNPQYDNTNSFECIDNLYNNDDNDYYDYNWSTSVNLKISGNGTGPTASIKPVTKFDNGVSKNYIRVILSMSQSKRQALAEKIQVIEDRISDTEDLINYYQGNWEKVLDFIENFDYNYYVENLNKSKILLSYRGELLVIINNLYSSLQDIYDYCVQSNIKISDFNYISYYDSCINYLNSAWNSLYKLGTAKDLSDLNDLSNATIRLNEERILDVYGAAVASQLKSLVQAYNLQITNKYQITYADLVRKAGNEYILQDELDALIEFEDGLIALPHNSSLIYLTTEHDNNGPEQEFINLKSQLQALINGISDTTMSLISYSAFVDDLLTPINDLLKIYKNTDYQNNYYNIKIEEQNNILTDYQGQLQAYQDMLLPSYTDQIVHIKPIVMLFNRYELSNINGWNGNKLYIDSQNNEYLLAPQVGAGAKNNGLFTGVLMGVKQFNSSTNKQRIGLFGYSSGIQSFLLNAEDGSAILGKSGTGQILIDPSNNEGLIYSSNFYKTLDQDGKPTSYSSSNEAGKGLLINFTKPEIRYGSGFFKVDENGNMHAGGGAESAQIHGDIGGWYITNQFLYSGNKKMYLDSNNPSVYGQTGSTKHNALTKTTEGFYLGPDGLSIGDSIRITAAAGGSVQVGRVTGSRCWTISGNTDNSYIGYNASAFDAGNLSNRDTYYINGNSQSVFISTEGVRLGTKFAVDREGNLVTKNLIARDGGSIGGWNISRNDLSASGITISSGGNIKGSNWNITSGSAEFNNITANGTGQIGGWTIGGSVLTGGGTTLDSNGTITCNTLYANNNGSIGGWNISGSGLSNGSFGLYSSGIIGPGFTLSGSGLAFTAGGVSLTAGGISLTEGNTSIGGSGIRQWTKDVIDVDFISSRIGQINLLYVNGLYSRGAITGGETSLGATRCSSLSIGDNEVATKDWVFDNFVQKGTNFSGTVTGTVSGSTVHGTCSGTL